MRKFAFLAAPLILVAASPAVAGVTAEALACPSLMVPQGIGAELIELVRSGDTKSPKVASLFDKVNEVALACSKKHKVPDADLSDYNIYVFDRVILDEVIRQLRSHSVPVEAIDEALGYGPGRPNPIIKDVGEAHVSKIDAALRLRGFDLGKAPEVVMELIGLYVGAQSGLVEDLAALK